MVRGLAVYRLVYNPNQTEKNQTKPRFKRFGLVFDIPTRDVNGSVRFGFGSNWFGSFGETGLSGSVPGNEPVFRGWFFFWNRTSCSEPVPDRFGTGSYGAGDRSDKPGQSLWTTGNTETGLHRKRQKYLSGCAKSSEL
jgi:hypothetical protein